MYRLSQIKRCPFSQTSISTRSMGQDRTTFEAWSGPNIGGPAHPTKFSQGEGIIAFRFSPLNVNQTCFPGRTVDSPCMLFTFTYLLRCVVYSQKSAVTSCSLLASSTNLHSLQTGYWSVLSSHWQGIISATRLIVASFVCILPHDVCQPKHEQTQQACAAEIAVLYAALACKQNKRYHTSARLTKTRDRCSNVNIASTGRTDRQTDRRTDRVRRNMRPPPREKGRITIVICACTANSIETSYRSDESVLFCFVSSLLKLCRIFASYLLWCRIMCKNMCRTVNWNWIQNSWIMFQP